MDILAMLGGKPVFDHPYKERWARPKEQEKKLISHLIDQNEYSEAGIGICKAFEETFAAYIGCRYCLTYSHGTDALMAAYFAVGVGPGDEVITPAVGYIASYAGALHMGARPIFCDVDPRSFLIDPDQVRKKITPRTRAINIIDLWGRVCNLDEIQKISAEYQIPIIADASHAHGGEWGGKKLGNSDHITCYSLQGVNPGGKGVAAGEGGVTCTNNRSFQQRLLAYCHLHREGIVKELEGSPYETLDREVLGLKSRAHPFALAVGLISHSTLDYRNAKRTQHLERLEKCLKEFAFIEIPRGPEKGKMAGFFGGLKFIYESAALSELPSEVFVGCLKAEGVPVNGPWVGFLEYRRSLFRGFDLWGRERGPLKGPWEGLEAFAGYAPAEFPNAEALSRKVFTLPSFIDIDESYFDKLVEALRKVEKLHKALLKNT